MRVLGISGAVYTRDPERGYALAETKDGEPLTSLYWSSSLGNSARIGEGE